MTAASKAGIKSDNSSRKAAEVVMKQWKNLMMFCWGFLWHEIYLNCPKMTNKMKGSLEFQAQR